MELFPFAFSLATSLLCLSLFEDKSVSCTLMSDSLQHLNVYDNSASSSSFGEPIFRLEPPSVINFVSSQGATILCLASGSPKPTISWYSSSSSGSGEFGHLSGTESLTQGQRPVGNVTNLRQILHNGSALRLLPFKETDFRQDIHSTEYRCVASNYLATIHSRSCLVQAGNRMAAFTTGELHVGQVEMSDFRRSYGCRVKHSVSGQVGSSSGLAQLILISTPDTSRPLQPLADQERPQVLHTVSQLIADENYEPAPDPVSLFARPSSGNHPHSHTKQQNTENELDSSPILLPCAIRFQESSTTGNLRWLFVPAGSEKVSPIQVNDADGYRVGPSYLALDRAKLSPIGSGRYLCELSQETICDIKVIIRRPVSLSLAVAPPTPSTSGSDLHTTFSPSTQYLNNEEELLASLSNPARQTTAVDPGDSGWFGRALEWFETSRFSRRRRSPMSWYSSSSTQFEPFLGRVRLRGSGLISPPPILQIGQSVRIECIASGQPVDSVCWFLNGEPVNAQTTPEIELIDQLDRDASLAQAKVGVSSDNLKRVISTLNIRSLQARHTGFLMFECFAQNSLGDRARAGHPLFLADRPMLDSVYARCPLNYSSPSLESGVPFSDESEGAWASREAGQLAFERTSPLQSAVLLENEPARLECPINWSNYHNSSLSNNKVTSFEWRKWVPNPKFRTIARPKIEPFEFSKNLEEGMRTWAVCGIVSGETPVDITWFKDGQLLLPDQETSIEQPADQLSSTLTFHRIRPAHSGLYTCVAANAFASANHSSKFIVNVAPFFIEAPKNRQAILGSSVLINCRAGGQPSPQIRWRKLLPARNIAPPGSSSSKLPSNTELNVEQTDLSSQMSQKMAAASINNQQQPEFRIITSNSHVQILENGSLIIKDVELSDSARYACQAFNGIQPSLSELIELTVLSPAQFDVTYETVSVKRDALVRFNCLPKGDQPMRIDWLKEGLPLIPFSGNPSEGASASSNPPSKYSELVHYVGAASSYAHELLSQPGTRPRHRHLLMTGGSSASLPQETQVNIAQNLSASSAGVRSSELLISYAERSDSGAFVCVARNAYGSDRLTYRLLVQEPPDSPSGLTCPSTQSSSLTLNWPAPFDGNLAISHYILEYRRVPDSSGTVTGSRTSGTSYGTEWLRLVVPAREQLEVLGGTSAGAAPSTRMVGNSQQAGTGTGTGSSNNRQTVQVVLRQLQAHNSYQIRVAAVNAMGQGAFSTPIVLTTNEEPPLSRPGELRTQPVSSSQLRVFWRGPALPDDQAPVRAYYVSHRRAPPILSGANGQTPVVSSSQQIITDQQRLWLGTQTVTANSSAQFPANYEVQLNNLEKNTRYEIRVQPYNSAGIGPGAETSGQTLKFDRPVQPTLKLVAARRHSLELKWSLNQVRNEDLAQNSPSSELLLGFSLFYKCEYDDWQEIQLAPIFRYLLENLRCGNKYQLYLSAFNSAGRSDPSDVLSVRTEGTAPLAPIDRSAFLRANISELVLDMSHWQTGGCPITSFLIQFKRLHDSSWFVLSEGATPFASSDKITVPDLVPATWYKLLVSASNEAGNTIAEYVFATLDSSGQPIQPSLNQQRELELQQLQETTGAVSGARSFLRQLFGGVTTTASGAGNEPDAGILLPLGCLLLLLITALASYLYYARPTRNRSRTSNSLSNGSSSSGCGNGRMLNTPSLGGSNQEGKHLIKQSVAGSQQFIPSAVARILLCGEQGEVSLDTQQELLPKQQASGLDSLLAGAGLQSFVGATSSGTLHRNNQHLRLLGGTSSAAYTTGPASSSMSTHSTNFDAQSSSQASSGGLNCPQVQLQDEQQVAVACPLNGQPNNETSCIYAGCSTNTNHPCNQTSNYLFSSQPDNNHSNCSTSDPSADPTSCHLFQASGNCELYQAANSSHAQTRLHPSASFASTADLLQRRQQQQQDLFLHGQDQEPIYQRLDTFKQMSKHFSSQRAQTLKFGSHLAENSSNNFNSPSDAQCNSMSLSRRVHLTDTHGNNPSYFNPQLYSSGQVQQSGGYTREELISAAEQQQQQHEPLFYQQTFDPSSSTPTDNHVRLPAHLVCSSHEQ